MSLVRAWQERAPFPVTDTPHERVAPHECAVYRFFDVDGVLLYVGIAWNPGRRWERHRRESAWFDKAVLVKVHVYRSEREALAAERTAIRHEKPMFNKRSAIR